MATKHEGFEQHEPVQIPVREGKVKPSFRHLTRTHDLKSPIYPQANNLCGKTVGKVHLIVPAHESKYSLGETLSLKEAYYLLLHRII